jgi:hypothetical protein
MVISLISRKMDGANRNLLTKIFTKEYSKMECRMAKACMCGRMGVDTRVNLRMEFVMAKGYSLIWMVSVIMDSLLTRGHRVYVKFVCRMEIYTRGI